MKSFKDVFETVDLPKGGDEKAFWDKHTVDKKDNPNAAPTQFVSDKKKSPKRLADYEEGDDKVVYEAVRTKRADKEPVIVRTIDKEGKSKVYTKLVPKGEIKIGEETELGEETIPGNVALRMVDMHKAAAAHHKKNSNMKGYAAHLNVSDRIEDAVKRAGPHMPIRSKQIDAASDKAFRDHPHRVVKSEEAKLDEKVKNPYAIGMAAAMKQADDTPPLKKSTIVKGHEIAKSIKKEALDPVGKHDADIDNDGDKDKSDKYLIKRRQAITRAINEAAEVRHDRYMRSHGKKARDSGQGSGSWMFTHKNMGDVDYKDKKEVHTTQGKFADAKKSAQAWAKEHGHRSVYVMEEVDLDEGHGVFLKGGSVGETRSGKPVEVHANIEDAKAQAKRLNKHLSPGEKKHYGLKYHVKPVSEEADQIDEAFKVGAMHLEDGSSVTLTHEDVNVLNGLFGQLNATNKTKMEQRMKSSKNGYNEILSFAKETI